MSSFSYLLFPVLAQTEELFLKKIDSVVLVRCVDTVDYSREGISSEQPVGDDQGHRDRKYHPLVPTDSLSNKNDVAAVTFFFEQCQLLGVPLTVVDDKVRFSAMSNLPI